MNLSNYKLYHCKTYVFLLIALCLFSFTGCSEDKKITEQEVQEVLNNIDVAAKNKDADAVLAYMSEKLQLKSTVVVSGKSQTSTLNRDQYRDMMKKMFAIASNYTYNRQNTQVKISPDGKSVIVSSEVTESITVNGQVIRTVANEVASLVKENGKLVTLYVEASGKQV
jgi:uncharacterized protein YcfL